MLGIVMRTEKQNTSATVRSADYSVRRRGRTEIPTQLRACMGQSAESAFDDVPVHYNLDMPSRLGALSYTQEMHSGGVERSKGVGRGHQTNESSAGKRVAIIQQMRNNVVQRCGPNGSGSGTSWYKPDGSINYPPNNGAVQGTEVKMTLKPGDTFGRYGNISEKSCFVTQTGADASKLALPPYTDPTIYKEYEVIKEIPDTIQAEIAPWGGSEGGGLQYLLPKPILQLIREGYIVPR